MNLLEEYNQSQLERIKGAKVIPEFKAGDTVKVNIKISEGATERIQAFQGVVIATSKNGVNSSFVVRKISHGIGVERKLKLHSPRIESIEVVKYGVVRRAKLYYMRDLSGKSARIKSRRVVTPK